MLTALCLMMTTTYCLSFNQGSVEGSCSWKTALMEVMLKSLAQKKVDLFILLYFSKAFGTLNHNITVIRLLLVTLHYYYFMVSATKLIKSYLSAFAWVIRSVHRRHLTVIAFFSRRKLIKIWCVSLIMRTISSSYWTLINLTSFFSC